MKEPSTLQPLAHDADCKCQSCLMLSAFSRAGRVLLLLALLWLLVFWAMGWL